MNTFYVNIAQNIGIDCDTPVNEEHPSIIKIKENANVSDFEFSPVTESQVKSVSNDLTPKKQLVLTQSHQKQLKQLPQLSQGILPKWPTRCRPETFPTQLKMAQVTPIFKEDDPSLEKNYRPVSILPTLSKIYERLLSEQLSDHFNSIFHDYLSAFRASYGCQTTLLRLVEVWKQTKTCTSGPFWWT